MSDPLDVLRRKQQINREQRDIARELRVEAFRRRQRAMTPIYEFAKALEDRGVRSRHAPRAKELIDPLGGKYSSAWGTYGLEYSDLHFETKDEEFKRAGFQIRLRDEHGGKLWIEVGGMPGESSLWRVALVGSGYSRSREVMAERINLDEAQAIEAIADLAADHLIVPEERS